MPLYLQAPRGPKAPNYKVRGTHQGIVVDRSTETDSEREATKKLKQWEREIERGEYADPRQKPADAVRRDKELVFGDAAIAYMVAGAPQHERKYLLDILAMTGEHALGPIPLRDSIDDRRKFQIALDRAAKILKPNVTPATRNRVIYTPVSAALKHVGFDHRIKRPKGSLGRTITTFLQPEQAAALFAACDSISAEFGLFVRLVCYTGMRRNEAFNIKVGWLSLADRSIHLPADITKNRQARTVWLTDDLIVRLANHPRGLQRHHDEQLFLGYNRSNAVRKLKRALKMAGLRFAPREGCFHLLCHTYATWMGRYNNMGAEQLVKTGRWKDARSAARYNHTSMQEEAKKADNLPVFKDVG